MRTAGSRFTSNGSVSDRRFCPLPLRQLRWLADLALPLAGLRAADRCLRQPFRRGASQAPGVGKKRRWAHAMRLYRILHPVAMI
jgi:hypothetical protein